LSVVDGAHYTERPLGCKALMRKNIEIFRQRCPGGLFLTSLTAITVLQAGEISRFNTRMPN
jgi:hypothetical protein